MTRRVKIHDKKQCRVVYEIPWFMRTGLYGTISIGVGVLYCGFYASALVTIPMILLLLAVGVCFRMLAYYRNWHLPMPK